MKVLSSLNPGLQFNPISVCLLEFFCMASGNMGALINADQRDITALLLISLYHLPDRHR